MVKNSRAEAQRPMQRTPVVISGTGLFTPSQSASNAELVEAFNSFVRTHNQEHAADIAAGTREPLGESSNDFIVKASGIKNRYLVDKSGVCDPAVMAPRLRQRSNEEPGILAEMGVVAAREALERAGKKPGDVDAVIVACSNMERAYPAIAIELQGLLGIGGYGFDLNVACSSATFGLHVARDMIVGGSAKSVLVVNPEICSGHLNFRDRDSHFIFGDACSAALVERADACTAAEPFEIVGSKLSTVFSNNIRNNFGFLNRATPEGIGAPDKLFVQQGRKVFKEVVPMVVALLREHLGELGIEPAALARLWMHQANVNMNELIIEKLVGQRLSREMAPIILDEYANTSSAGVVIAFHKYHQDLPVGSLSLMCSFGAGYSIGNLVLRRHAR
jgi:beta-ketodecanoyl-[acyl-carrier-protein] synthase